MQTMKYLLVVCCVVLTGFILTMPGSAQSCVNSGCVPYSAYGMEQNVPGGGVQVYGNAFYPTHAEDGTKWHPVGTGGALSGTSETSKKYTITSLTYVCPLNNPPSKADPQYVNAVPYTNNPTTINRDICKKPMDE